MDPWCFNKFIVLFQVALDMCEYENSAELQYANVLTQV
jgi:hypothetical protein